MEQLKSMGYMITTAESCTGGLLAGRILNVAGASDVYSQGYITYSNDAKEEILHVAHETLGCYGAVSPETATEMALGACSVANAEVALSVTGIAGPGGGTKEKPVGLVYIGCCILGNVRVKKLELKGTRAENRKDSVTESLLFALEQL